MRYVSMLRRKCRLTWRVNSDECFENCVRMVLCLANSSICIVIVLLMNRLGMRPQNLDFLIWWRHFLRTGVSMLPMWRGDSWYSKGNAEHLHFVLCAFC